MSIEQICNDENLLGHCLFSLPEKLFSFSQGDFSLYERPDPGSYVVKADYGIIRRVSYTIEGNRTVFRSESIIDQLLCDVIEFVGRRILGSFGAAISSLTARPIGFTVKAIHFYLQNIGNHIASIPFVQEISQIWNNASLIGHSLTSAPLAFHELATAPLSWHLRPDGSDRRSFRALFADGIVTRSESEYELVPFELFETIYRRIFCGLLTIATGMVSPLGLAAKGIDLTVRSTIKNF